MEQVHCFACLCVRSSEWEMHGRLFKVERIPNSLGQPHRYKTLIRAIHGHGMPPTQKLRLYCTVVTLRLFQRNRVTILSLLSTIHEHSLSSTLIQLSVDLQKDKSFC